MTPSLNFSGRTFSDVFSDVVGEQELELLKTGRGGLLVLSCGVSSLQGLERWRRRTNRLFTAMM